MVFIEWLNNYLDSLFSSSGISAELAFYFKALSFIVLITLLSVVSNWVAKSIILVIVRKIILKSNFKWDDILLEKKVFQRLSHLAPVSVIYIFGPVLMVEYPTMARLSLLLGNVYVVFVILIVVYALLDSAGAIYNQYDIAKTRPIKGYIQVTKIITGLIAGIFALSILFDRSPLYFFTGLGAITAILLLIFKDTILGFVAGVQVTTNNLVQIGDWLEMPKYGADGDVIDISLHSVIIRNFDRTLTTIPTYALVSDSFKNWRGMVQSGGRRIMRDVYIDIGTIKFCDEEMCARFESVYLLKEYIAQKKKEIDEYNKKHNFDTSITVNGRRMTNIGTFRAYILRYLQNHPGIHKEMPCMVRQMPPGEKGVALQVYTFTNDVRWVVYEGTQADIFDHILAIAGFFDLRIFQFPSQITFNHNIHPR